MRPLCPCFSRQSEPSFPLHVLIVQLAVSPLHIVTGTDAPACEAFSGLGRKNCEHWFFYTHANALVACELTSEGECKAAEPVFCRVRDPHVTVVREHAR